MEENLIVERLGHVLVLTLNRPKKLNAMDSALYIRLTDELRGADKDDDIRAVVIRGAGTSFCSGADTGEFAELTPDNTERVEARAGLTYELHKTIPEISKPVIGAVHGYTVGGGCGLALACDITIASANVKMGYPEIKHGLVAAVVMANLTKQLGRKAGFELVATGRLVGAEEAAALGMVTRVVPEGEEYTEALKVAQALAEQIPTSLQATKRLFHKVADLPLAEGLVRGREANEEMREYRAEALKDFGAAVKAAKAG
ncbi:enoyl-CoA hydratase/isomerase family protein [Rhodococcus sp. HM1]|uniref:enoyl-CoA hydratase/isomerase family protein n=1 Tax=unclassified Rhodococcus (in: high G+C Gram-positive bacteria) TaxID=192944 RepID=UPI0018CE926D|nr:MULTISPECIES: enoyl-CoA hydratase/isomerase family protein [unclassified Rhodococcus (in: high G+C Gram-positive bacteria)]MBH0122198.1 enoyl-CoA hydratase/isomerase family protein [Rhodococcus sp. CX]MCK8669948.1 enoyl-CoA hydratase/isomerase family protein [Rhodococcus sp. HM1]